MSLPVHEGSGPIGVVTVPSDDAVFATRVREILESIGDLASDELVGALEERLKLVHPQVTLRRRTGMAGFGEEIVYAFRDGSALSRFEDLGWLDDAATARVITDAQGTYVDANPAAAQLFGVAAQEIVGKPAGTFTTADSRIRDGAALWRALEQTGRLHSLAVLHCPDGSERRVEFVTVKGAAGPGQHVTYLREL